MNDSEYERFTEHLVSWAQEDLRAGGLVALGSMADASRRDEWSDHDFWVLARDGRAEELRSDPSWLPDSERIVVHVRETAHGRSAVYDDGHLIEYAVFEKGELGVARANDYLVLVDDGTLEGRMRAMADLTRREHAMGETRGADFFGSFVAQMVIGLTRFARGEALSANHLIRGWAVRSLLSALASAVEAEQPELLDDLDPHRRFELASPELGARLGAALELPIPELAAVLVEVADAHLAGTVPGATPAAIAALRSLLGRVREATS